MLNNPISELKNSDVLIILNKSEEFKKIPSSKLKKLNKRLFIIDPNYICNNLE